MTNIITRLHLFLKFSTSLILIGIIVFLLYLFYISYRDKLSTSNKKDEFDFFEQNFLTFEKSINGNFDEIKALGNKIINNKKSIETLTKSINFEEYENLIKQYKIELKTIKSQNLKLKEELSFVSKKLNNTDSKKINEINFSLPLKDILDLIKIKLSLGKKFDKEINIIENLYKTPDNESNIEKIKIISQKRFYSLEKLTTEFEQLSSKYIEKRISENSNFIFMYFLKFVSIKPNKNNEISEEYIYNLVDIKKNLEEKKWNELKNKIKFIKKIEIFNSWERNIQNHSEANSILEKII